MKKLLSVLLCMVLIISSISVATFSAASTNMSLKQAIEIYEKESGEKVEKNRYYFLMPNGKNGQKGTQDYMHGEFAPSWYNDNATTAGIYWWGTNKLDPEWPGYKMMMGDSDSIYYADIPDFVEVIMFNNYFNGGNDFGQAVWYDQCQSTMLYTSGYEKNESKTYPNGLDSFEDMIYVIDPSLYAYEELEPSRTFSGEWYYYYGNGCYGTVADGNEYDCIRDDHDHENLYINFDPSKTGWTDYSKIYCVIYGTTHASFYPGKSIPTLCTDYDGDGIYTYDLNKSNIKLNDKSVYWIEFMTDTNTNKHTVELELQTTNIKDTVYATGDTTTSSNRPYIKWTNEVEISIPRFRDVVKEYEKENNTKVETYRNFFLIPDGSDKFVDEEGLTLPNWFNEHSTNICISYYNYNANGFPNPYPKYIGFSIEKDHNNVYYADIPVNIDEYYIHNGVTAQSVPTYTHCTSFTLGPACNDYYNEEFTTCDNMIYVFDIMDWYSCTTTAMCGGDWYYYLGGECYSDTENGDCINKYHNHMSVKEAVAEYEAQTGEAVETNRYYFLMPNGTNGDKGNDADAPSFNNFAPSWYNEFTDEPAIYWWNQDTVNPDTEIYPGYTVEKGDSESVFYADVPKDVTVFFWNNNINHSAAPNDKRRLNAMQTIYIPSEYYDAGESENYPDGTDSFDEMIFVVDPDIISIGVLPMFYDKPSPFGGEWYYYYGDGCYGFTKDGDYKNCLRGDHNHLENEHISGDTDRDGVLSVMDATEIQMVVAKAKTFKDETAKLLADFDNDSQVSVMDATAIQIELAQLS